jgi:hypothetical protein
MWASGCELAGSVLLKRPTHVASTVLPPPFSLQLHVCAPVPPHSPPLLMRRASASMCCSRASSSGPSPSSGLTSVLLTTTSSGLLANRGLMLQAHGGGGGGGWGGGGGGGGWGGGGWGGGWWGCGGGGAGGSKAEQSACFEESTCRPTPQDRTSCHSHRAFNGCVCLPLWESVTTVKLCPITYSHVLLAGGRH